MVFNMIFVLNIPNKTIDLLLFLLEFDEKCHGEIKTRLWVTIKYNNILGFGIS